MARLADDEIAHRLQALPNWQRTGDEIIRTVTMASFRDGIALVMQIADLAEAADHHPDIDIRYRTIRLALTTHAERGLTERDFTLAEQIDEALAALPTSS